MINSTEGLFITLIALLPGFVAQIAYQTVVPRMTPSGASLVLQSLGFAVVNASVHAFWLAPLLLLPQSAEAAVSFFQDSPVSVTILALIYAALSPFLIGYLFGLARVKIRLPGMKHHAPTAWDSFFERKPACIVFATLRNGTRVAGEYIGETNGFAASYPLPERIYCGRQFRLNADGRIIGPPTDDSMGVIIRSEDCLLLEFLQIPTIDKSPNLFVQESSHGTDDSAAGPTE